MPLTPEQTTFRRIQTDDPRKLTVFLSVDGTLATGEQIAGPWTGIDITLTDTEVAAAQAVVARARVELCARVNAPAQDKSSP